MTRYFACLCMLAIPAGAQELTARQMLDPVVSTYDSLKAAHLVAGREETAHPAGRSITTFPECEPAAKPGHRSFARLQEPQRQALAVSHGSNIWRALDSRKQWATVAAASLTDDRDEERGAKAARGDLRDSLVRRHLIRADGRGAEIELVDRQRFVVWQYKEKGDSPEGRIEIAMKMKRVDLNQMDGEPATLQSPHGNQLRSDEEHRYEMPVSLDSRREIRRRYAVVEQK